MSLQMLLHMDGCCSPSEASRQHICDVCLKALTNTEQQHTQIEKETLASVWPCEGIAEFLSGTFPIETDHKPLVPLLRSTNWMNFLHAFNTFICIFWGFTCVWKNMATLDVLSRAVKQSNRRTLWRRNQAVCGFSHRQPSTYWKKPKEIQEHQDNDKMTKLPCLTSHSQETLLSKMCAYWMKSELSSRNHSKLRCYRYYTRDILV